MDAFVIITTLAIVLASHIILCQALCSQCPFQWTQHQQHCYRIFSGPLIYEASKEYCQYKATNKGNGKLATVSSLDEMLFLMWLVGNMTTTSKLNAWLDNGADSSVGSLSTSYYHALNENGMFSNFFKPCDKLRSPVQDRNTTTCMVPAPEVVEHRCAVCTEEWVTVDLGDFTEDCVSDPDVCVSDSASWSLWLKIDTPANSSNQSYSFVSNGGLFESAGCVGFYRNGTSNSFVFEVRSQTRSKTWRRMFTEMDIPMNAWFHLVATLDMTRSSSNLLTYVDGKLFPDSTENDIVSPVDCTRLYLGSANSGAGYPPSSSYGMSAAYSNLIVFDGLLTEEEVTKLHECGSLDWNLKVRSLYLDNAYSDSTCFRYICTASASTGPTIYWKVYHANLNQWEDLGQSTGDNFNITQTSFSPCVIQSALVINRTHWLGAQGDVITCTANSGTWNASVHTLQVGPDKVASYTDQSNVGLFVPPGKLKYYSNDVSTTKRRPFICKKTTRWNN